MLIREFLGAEGLFVLWWATESPRSGTWNCQNVLTNGPFQIITSGWCFTSVQGQQGTEGCIPEKQWLQIFNRMCFYIKEWKKQDPGVELNNRNRWKVSVKWTEEKVSIDWQGDTYEVLFRMFHIGKEKFVRIQSFSRALFSYPKVWQKEIHVGPKQHNKAVALPALCQASLPSESPPIFHTKISLWET